MKINTNSFFLIFFSALLTIGVFGASFLNNDLGNIQVSYVSIPNDEGSLHALLYRPNSAIGQGNSQPVVILTHGISGSKETVSGIGLELARRGFVAINVDEIGHGNSGGALSNPRNDPSLGILAAVQWAESQSYIDSSVGIGLVGHSMGAGAIQFTAMEHNIRALVLIGGSINDEAINNTYPQHVLVTLGQQDALFDVNELKTSILPPLFNSPGIVESGQLYGTFSGVARKLIISQTTHLFEPLDPVIVSETVDWLIQSLKNGSFTGPIIGDNIYTFREALLVVGLLGLVGLMVPLSLILRNFLFTQSQITDLKEINLIYGQLEDWKVFVLWGILGLGLFVPILIAGNFIPPFNIIPPLIFGGALAWWLLAVAVIGILIIYFKGSSIASVNFSVRAISNQQLNRNDAVIGLILTAIMYFIAVFIENLLIINFRIYVPFFADIGSPLRIINFFIFFPFVLIYFFIEGLVFHVFHDWESDVKNRTSEVRAVIKINLIKTLPYLMVLALLYIPQFLFNTLIFPSQAAFLLEFLVLILFIFIITTTLSWFSYRQTGNITTGTIINAILVAWISASLFPLRG